MGMLKILPTMWQDKKIDRRRCPRIQKMSPPSLALPVHTLLFHIFSRFLFHQFPMSININVNIFMILHNSIVMSMPQKCRIRIACFRALLSIIDYQPIPRILFQATAL